MRPAPRPRRAPAALLAAALAAAVAAAGSPAAPYADAIERSRALLDAALQLYPGTSVAVAVGNDIVWSTAFGYADVERHRPVSRATQFRIYEVAMPLTTAVMARLADEGRLDLDAPVQRYLPGLVGAAHPVTARQLAAHLSGARDFAGDENAPAPCASAREAARRFESGTFVRPPGLAFSPSRPGYVLLSAVLEAASGKDFAALLSETLASPAAMPSTMPDDPRRFLPGRTRFYERGWFGLLSTAPDVDVGCRFGAGGLVSTTGDLARFGAALVGGELVRPETARALFTPQRTRTGTDTGYGLGWHVDTDARGRVVAWHGGRGVGGRAAIVVVPHARLVVVMLSNIEGERLDEHARRIAAWFVESIEASGGAPDVRRASGPPGKSASPLAFRALPAPGE